MVEKPRFNKPDRYKTSSFKTYNFKLPKRYDASIWMKVFSISSWDQAVVSMLGPNLASLRILDAGCATGRLLSALADAGAAHLSGTDLAPNILDVARDKFAARRLNADLRWADIEDHVPWPDDSFDVVTMMGVLHHLFRPYDALHEVNRVLRPGGMVIVVEPWFRAPLRQIVNTFLRVAPHEGDYRFYSPKGVANLLAEGGWTRAGWRGVGRWSFAVTAFTDETPTQV